MRGNRDLHRSGSRVADCPLHQSVGRLTRRLRTLSFLVFASVVLLQVMPGTSAHKFHVSVSQIEYHAPSRSAKLMIRVFADDLETAITRHAGRPVKIQGVQLAGNREVGELIHGYLLDKLDLKTNAGRPVQLSWSGLEAQADVVWLYVEGRLPGGLTGARLRNRLFCELFEDQVNIVNTKHRQQTIGLMFEPKDDYKVITEKALGR